MPTVSDHWPYDCPCRPFLVGDLLFGCYESSPQEAVKNAVRIMKEGNMDAVKLEGGPLVFAATRDHSPCVTDLHSSLSAAGTAANAALKPQQRAFIMKVMDSCTGNLNLVRILLDCRWWTPQSSVCPCCGGVWHCSDGACGATAPVRQCPGGLQAPRPVCCFSHTSVTERQGGWIIAQSVASAIQVLQNAKVGGSLRRRECYNAASCCSLGFSHHVHM